MEPFTWGEPMETKENQGLDKRIHIHFEHRRHRLADPGGISEKACLDGMVIAGILGGDSHKEIDEPTHKQVKIPTSEPEITIITLEEQAEHDMCEAEHRHDSLTNR